eukprot:scaffold5057_cov274-Prasinococcus_capsulatus_cf.AAC.1
MENGLSLTLNWREAAALRPPSPGPYLPACEVLARRPGQDLQGLLGICSRRHARPNTCDQGALVLEASPAGGPSGRHSTPERTAVHQVEQRKPVSQLVRLVEEGDDALVMPPSCGKGTA